VSYNGSGTFLINSSGQPVVTGTTITSTAFNALTADLATGLTTAITKDGQTTPTANIPMGGFKFTGLAAGTGAGNSLRYEQVIGVYLPLAGGTVTGNIAQTGNLAVTGTTTLTGALNLSQGANIASATTTDIGAATGNYVVVTGTTTITGLGTITAGVMRTVEFSGALTLTHNATSLILPGAANITTAAGDVAIFVSEGSGNWRCASYVKASGQPVALGTQGTFTATLTGCTTSPTATATYSITNNVVTLFIPSLLATSNTNACTITGAPVAIRPATQHAVIPIIVTDNSSASALACDVETSGTITLRGPGFSPTGFTGSGTKGNSLGTTKILYSLLLLPALAFAQPHYYSGVGDGVTDNTATMNAAQESVCASNNRDLVLPVGAFRFLSPPNAPTCAINLVGSGKASTKLIKAYSGLGSYFLKRGQNAADTYGGGSIRNLTLWAGSESTDGIAIWVVATVDTGGLSATTKNPHGMLIDNVMIGKDVGGGSFGFGIYLDGSNNPGPGAIGVRGINIRDTSVNMATVADIYLYNAKGVNLIGVDCYGTPNYNLALDGKTDGVMILSRTCNPTQINVVPGTIFKFP
jgi:hypothetical protein